MAKRQARRRVKRKPERGFASWSIGKKAAAIFGGTILVAATAGVVLVASKIGKIDNQKLDITKLNITEEAEEKLTGYTNVALFGVDSRDNELVKDTRSDTIMIASLNNETKEVKLVSVFRDTLLEQDDGTFNKANAAYSFGGPEETVAMLNKNLDLDITKYVTVNFNAMVSVIDAVGGIEIDVQPDEVNHITNYAGEIIEATGIDSMGVFEPGPQVLNGVQATGYARIRATAGDDFRRTERQRDVLQKIIEKAQHANLAVINKIIDTVFPQISTNFTLSEILGYAKDASKYRLAETSGFPAVIDTDTLAGIGSIVVPLTLESNVIELHKYLFGEDGYMPSGTLCTISDGIAYRVETGEKATEEETTYYDEGIISTPSDNHDNSTGYIPPPVTPDTGIDNGGQTGGTEGTDGTGGAGQGNAGGSDSGSGGSGGSSDGTESGGSTDGTGVTP